MNIVTHLLVFDINYFL